MATVTYEARSGVSVPVSIPAPTFNAFGPPAPPANDRYAALADLDLALRQQNMKHMEEAVTLTAANDNSYISLRDAEFLGPDRRLEQLLRRRMAAPAHLASELGALGPAGEPARAPPAPHHQFRRARNKKTTTAQVHRTVRKFDDYNAEDLKPKILRFQQYLIQLTKEFIEEVDETPVVKQIEKDERTRIATVFAKLDQWLMRMRTLHQSTLNVGHKKLFYTWMPVERRALVHFYYYQHILRAHVDITYTVEFINHIHARSVRGVPRGNATRTRRPKKRPEEREYDEEDNGEFDEEKIAEEVEQMAQQMEKYKDMELTEEQQQYISEMLEAGLEPTDPP